MRLDQSSVSHVEKCSAVKYGPTDVQVDDHASLWLEVLIGVAKIIHHSRRHKLYRNRALNMLDIHSRATQTRRMQIAASQAAAWLVRQRQLETKGCARYE